MNYKVLLVDDHVIIRRGLRNLFHDRFHISHIEEASSIAELRSSLQRQLPDILVLDLQLSDGNSIDLLEDLCKDHPEVRILIYSMRSERIYAQRVLALGSSGFLAKESDEEEVVRAIRKVLQGQKYLSHETELRLLDQQDVDHADPFQCLSRREVGVMEELLAGHGVTEIASRLGLQTPTVATYKARLFDKLGVANILELQQLAQAHRS